MAERDYIPSTTIPDDLRPRILNMIAAAQDTPAMKAVFFKANHFQLGIEASQTFVDMAGLHMASLRKDLLDFAPMPFETFTISCWVGVDGTMVEFLLVIAPDGHGRPALGEYTLEWGKNHTAQEQVVHVPRDVAQLALENATDPDRIRVWEARVQAWDFIDAFRLLLATPGAAMINKGAAPRKTFSKGRRVNFYTASAVTIDLDKAGRLLTTNHTGHGRSMPSYGYRAHLCHSGGSATCVHEWIEIGGKMVDDKWVPDVDNGRANATWQCYHCDRKRWHRRAGERGSLKVGEVRQTYRVKKGRTDIVPS